MTVSRFVRKYVLDANRPLRTCHPGDIVKQPINFATCRGESLAMTIDLIDRATRSTLPSYTNSGLNRASGNGVFEMRRCQGRKVDINRGRGQDCFT